jgi:hypothetical protein
MILSLQGQQQRRGKVDSESEKLDVVELAVSVLEMQQRNVSCLGDGEDIAPLGICRADAEQLRALRCV